MPYTPLIAWVKRADALTGKRRFADIMRDYTSAMRKVYASEMESLYEHIKVMVRVWPDLALGLNFHFSSSCQPLLLWRSTL